MTFDCFSQNKYFIDDSWEKVIKFSIDRNQMLFVYIYSEKCDVCKELDEKVFSNTEKMNRLLENVIFYKADFNDKINGQKIVEKFSLTKTPTFLFLRWNDNIYHKVEPIVGDFDLESMYESIKIELENGIKKNEIVRKYNENKNNPQAIKDYNNYLIKTYPNFPFGNIVNNYLKVISPKEQLSEETLQMILKSGNYFESFTIEILLRQLQKATIQENLYNQYIIKDRIITSIIPTFNRGYVLDKINLNKAIEFAESCNKITPNFKNNDKSIFEIYFHASVPNKSKFLNLSKYYYNDQKPNLRKDKLRHNDSLFYNQIKNYLLKDTLLSFEQKNILKSKNNYYSNTQAANLIFIAKGIYILDKFPKNIEFGIQCAKKSIEFAPNATRYAICGLLHYKNEEYKAAYEMLIKATELEIDEKDKIDADVYKDAFSTLLEIKKRIPENY